jgi:tetratricopeptide (TPR) repeat protein
MLRRGGSDSFVGGVGEEFRSWSFQIDWTGSEVVVHSNARALDRISDVIELNKNSEIERLMGLAYDLLDQGSSDDAERAFRAAGEVAPNWSVPWYELGLICKYQGRWKESLEYNARAAELDARDEAAWWNMGDPARARIENVPFPRTEYRWQDLVLHDGAPDGYRILDGREVPVFNVLDRIEVSGFRTYSLP